jgi:excisionase family DNA binding protein
VNKRKPRPPNSGPASVYPDDGSWVERAYVTADEFVQLTGLSLSTVRRYLASGRLPKVQPGGDRCRVLIPRGALQEYCRSSTASDESVGPHPVDGADVPLSSNSSTPRRHGPAPKWTGRR